MFASIYFLFLFTAVLTNSYNEAKRVGVIKSSEGSRMCQVKRYQCIEYGTSADLFSSFRSHQIDSVIQDKEIINKYLDGYDYIGIIYNKAYDGYKINNYIKF